MKILLSLSLALTLGFAACGGDKTGDNSDAGASARNGDTAAASNSQSSGGIAADGAGDTAASAAGGTIEAGSIQEHTFHGEVKKIDTERQMITIDHEKIGDYMEAMTMPFKVADPALLSRVTVGQQSHFTLRVAGDQALITKIQDEHEGGESH